MRISLIGDYQAEVTAHQAIPIALSLAAESLGVKLAYEWVATPKISQEVLASTDAIWCVPYSPYLNAEGVIEAIRFARENEVPWLGTCAGYQHAILEVARNQLGFAEASSVEDQPDAAMPLISALACSLYDEKDLIQLQPNTRVNEIYQQNSIKEAYHCGYGINPDYLSVFESSELIFSGFDAAGEPRILELPQHRFFIGTAFQPERSAFDKIAHPLVRAFLQAAL